MIEWFVRHLGAGLGGPQPAGEACRSPDPRGYEECKERVRVRVDRVKRLVELTVEDLVASPVWRYEAGSGAAALVAPTKRQSLSQSDDEIFLGATEFELFGSGRFFGFCFPADDSGLDYLQPVIVTRSGHVTFWFDGPAAPEVLSGQWRALGKEPGDIFPIAFRCLVPVDGRTVSGHIDGVQSSEDLMSGPAAPRILVERGSPERIDIATRSPRGAVRIPTARPVQPRRDTGPVEKRTARRRKAGMTVEFTQGALHGTGTIKDVSPRGMFVHSTRIPDTGPALRLTVNLPDGRRLLVTGRVVRGGEGFSPSAPSPGFGLLLAEESPEYEDFFSRLPDKPE